MIEAEGKIKITHARWNVTIEIDGQTYIASADNFYTGGSGIWFGTKEDYDEIWEESYPTTPSPIT